ncbi:MAG: glucose-1-phosphate adenylyltransferase, partial [Candidatus Omnitrophica bacterium]|nr:glucose-1-phosphate adenylyltransferase [Candidatus Omnitrophota bacterium]
RTYGFMYDGYWKDIGSIPSFYEENLAFTDACPPLDLFDEDWQFFTRPRHLPLTKLLGKGTIENSNIAEGAIIEDARISHSIIGLRSIIGAGTEVKDSIIMGNDYFDFTERQNSGSGKIPKLGIGKNCRIQKTIVDKNVRMGDDVKVVNKKNLQEFENEYCVIRNGIVIIPKNTVIPEGTVI